MAIITAPTLQSQAVSPARDKKTQPFTVWAWIGAAVIAFQVYVIGGWLLSGPERTPTGRTPVPDWLRISTDIQEILYPAASAVVVYFALIRPWRREHRLQLDGMFCIAALMCYWQDPWSTFFVPWAMYSTTFTNWGSWAGNFPGFMTPLASQWAEPPFVTAPVYMGMMFGAIVAANAVMRWAKRRRPSIGTPSLVAICFVVMFFIDLVLECIFVRAGWYVYTSTVGSWTLFKGHYYQFPVYESLMFGGTMTACALLRYFRNDKGETLADRGMSEVKMSPRKESLVRLAAIIGFFNVAFFIVYTVPATTISFYGDPFPEDIMTRSYFLDGMCGPDTPYESAGSETPIPRQESGHVDAEGNFVPREP